MPNPQWLLWARQIQAIAQNGLTYTEGVFDRERYTQLRALAQEILATYTDMPAEALSGIFGREVGYATPKIDVRGAVFRDGKVLLVRERSDGLWTLPGGWVDVDDPPSKAVEREIREESGYRTRAVKLAAVWDRNLHGHPPHAFHIYKLAFICELLDGTATHSIETDAVDWFAPDALPPLSLTRVMPSQVARLFEHARQPDLPADFD
ncbi:MAG: NUDIX hydrolase [Caldilineaceae bacterium]